ncbi:MAG: hypothetical protein AAB399_01365 [Patescibacteria group bacterium]
MVSNQRLNIKEVLRKIESQRLAVITPNIFAQFFNVSLSNARIFLSRNAKSGNFIRLRKGLYSSINFQPSSLEIANLIQRPSYISLEIALSYYHVIPETVYVVTSITTKHSKDINVLNQIYRYHQINKGLYFGYQKIHLSNRNIIIATKEKALLDYLYFVARGQKKYNERFDLRSIDKVKLQKYSKAFFKNIKNKHIKKRFGLLLVKINL